MRAEKRKKKSPLWGAAGTRQATTIQSVPALIFCCYLAWQIARNGTSAAEQRPAERDVLSVSAEKKKSNFYVNCKKKNGTLTGNRSLRNTINADEFVSWSCIGPLQRLPSLHLKKQLTKKVCHTKRGGVFNNQELNAKHISTHTVCSLPKNLVLYQMQNLCMLAKCDTEISYMKQLILKRKKKRNKSPFSPTTRSNILSSCKLWRLCAAQGAFFQNMFHAGREREREQWSCEAHGTFSSISSFDISFSFIDPSLAAALISHRNTNCQHKPLIIA